jgi:hypothetical protein
METVERVPLGLSEWRSYAYEYIGITVDMQNSEKRVKWTNSEKRSFRDQFESL